jgi:hypothetical protein
MFADDTCLLIEVEDPTEAANMVNEDLESISQWAKKWLVKFSPPKTEEMIISNKRNKPIHPDLQFDNTTIKRVDDHKHLGVTISHDLSWSKHIKEVTAKATRRLGVMRKLKYKLDRRSLEKMYMGFIRPLLEYGDILWDSPMEVLDPLETIQRNAARIVTGATAKARTEGLYKETNWVPLAKRRENHRLSLFFKITNGLAPQYLLDLQPQPVANRTGYALRNRHNLDTPIARINCLSYSFFPATTRLWNDLDQAVKNKPSVQSFRMGLKIKEPKRSNLFYHGTRLENSIHARLRIENSPLNADLCNILHVIDSPLCPCGQGLPEDAKHFFMKCPLYDQIRLELNLNLLPYVINNVDYLLFGVPNEEYKDNIKIFTAVQKFIRDSRRFY